MEYLCLFWKVINSSLISSFLGGVLSILAVYYILEDRLKVLAELKEKKRLMKNLMGDLSFNLYLADEYAKKSLQYVLTNEFNVAEYRTLGMEVFLNARAFDFNNDFYDRLNALIVARLVVDNNLLKILWFAPDLTKHDRQNIKKVVVANSKIVAERIKKLISEVEKNDRN